jgi:hypothetical protein
MEVIEPLNETLDNLVQRKNTDFPIVVIDFGIVILLSDVQFAKISNSKLFKEFDNVILANLEQPENAPCPMLVTESGIVILVILRLEANANSPMPVIPSGILTLVDLPWYAVTIPSDITKSLSAA